MFNFIKKHAMGEPKPQTQEKQININVVNAIELKPDSTYLIVADSHHVSPVDIQQLRNDLKKAGIKNVVGFMLSGTPDDAIQIVHSNNQKKRKR